MTADKANNDRQAPVAKGAGRSGLEKDAGAVKAREKAKGKRKSAIGEYLRKADPIAMTCFIVVVLAFAVVGGSFIKDECFGDDDGKTIAKQGDTVEVEYVGSYIAYYDEAGAVVFDTNIEDVADDASKLFSPSFKKAASFKYLSFQVGGTSVLKDFGDSVVGHSVGDVVRVAIAASDDAYGKTDTTTTADGVKSFPIMKNGEMTLEAYNRVCGTSYTSSSFVSTSPINGVDFIAAYDQDDDMVRYTFIGEVSGEHTLACSDKTVVTLTDNDASFTIAYDAVSGVHAGFLQGNDGMEPIFIEPHESNLTWWPNDLSDHAEQKGETMYFFIKIKTIKA